ncbi:hypothetical protein MP228_003066 [Amoeboaphelidium protococcarum]|nr:hypothetical protein MP228_003066 [Amoeboaphelidium protococcarum]
MYQPAVVADMVSRLARATGLWNIPLLKADCRVLENMIAELPGYEKTAKFRSDWFAQSYVASWMASCHYKNPQSIVAKLPIWFSICYAADPRRAFLAVSVLHALSELPDMDQDQLMRAVQVKPGNLVTCEQLESPLYCLALKMCMDAVFPQQSYAGDILQNFKRAHTSSFRLDSLKQQIVQIESTSLPTQDMSKCAKCGEIKVAECMTCNCSFCNVHSADHTAHATTLEESDPGSDSMSSGDTHDSNI